MESLVYLVSKHITHILTDLPKTNTTRFTKRPCRVSRFYVPRCLSSESLSQYNFCRSMYDQMKTESIGFLLVYIKLCFLYYLAIKRDFKKHDRKFSGTTECSKSKIHAPYPWVLENELQKCSIKILTLLF